MGEGGASLICMQYAASHHCRRPIRYCVVVENSLPCHHHHPQSSFRHDKLNWACCVAIRRRNHMWNIFIQLDFPFVYVPATTEHILYNCVCEGVHVSVRGVRYCRTNRARRSDGAAAARAWVCARARASIRLEMTRTNGFTCQVSLQYVRASRLCYFRCCCVSANGDTGDGHRVKSG